MVQAMKLSVFGLSVSSSWGSEHASLWRGLMRALAALGHQVTFYERAVPQRAAHREWTAGPAEELVLYSDFATMKQGAAPALRQTDVALVTSDCPDALAAGQLIHESAVPIRAFYDLDAPATGQRISRGEALPYIGSRGLADFDVVLSYAGGRALTELRNVLGARRVATLYDCVDPHLHAPSVPLRKFRADLSYLGAARGAEPQAALNELFLALARARADLTFAVGGTHYLTGLAGAANIKYLWQVVVHEQAAFFCSARLNLLLAPTPMAVTGYCPPARLFEAAACGAAVLTNDWPGLREFYEPGKEVIVVRDADDVLAALALSERDLAAVRRRARERTLAQHTAELRARQLSEILDQARVGPQEFARMAASGAR
ncbi:MAG: hypothetical protein RL701_7561 [Pseudomonadota bacterium]